MTDQNNAAQPGLTDDDIRSIWVEHGLDDEAVEDFARAIESALLSKLRAEGVQAGEPVDERAAFDNWLFLGQCVIDPEKLSGAERSLMQIAWKEGRAALESAPVAGEAQEPVGEVFRHGEGRDENGPRVGIRMLPAAAGLPHGTQVYAAPQASALAAEYALGRADGFDAAKAAPQTSEAVLKQILHSIKQARIVGNDWRRELELIENTVTDALKTQADNGGGDCAKGAGEQEK